MTKSVTGNVTSPVALNTDGENTTDDVRATVVDERRDFINPATATAALSLIVTRYDFRTDRPDVFQRYFEHVGLKTV